MRLPVLGDLSLATKLIGLFGLAVTAVAVLALLLPFGRMQYLVEAGQRETARALHDAWVMLPAEPAQLGDAGGRDGEADGAPGRPSTIGDALVLDLSRERATERAAQDWRFAQILRRADEGSPEGEEVFLADWEGWERRYTYARITRDDAGRARRFTVLERTSDAAATEAAINSLFLLTAGTIVLAVALSVFWFIIERLVISPVSTLRRWAESVGDGNTDERVDLSTGDEFEQLAETFNATLDQLEEREQTLRSINIAMDVRLSELAEVNEALDKAARLKSEFLASVSHELRTPLNSIIGFTDLLLDIARQETRALAAERPNGTTPADTPPDRPRHAEDLERRRRYLENIVDAARALQALIEGLLEMAKLEAGRTEIHPERVNPVDSCRAIVAMSEPMATRKGVAVELDARPDVPLIETDPRKLQQILFNLVTNAVKFTDRTGSDGKPGRVAVRVERVPGEDGVPSVRVCVIDNGPGIAREDQEAVFERFSQLESGLDRAHAGVGLGLAISRELASLLQADMQLVSELGQGAMFSVILPLRLDPVRLEEARMEARFRGALSRRSEYGAGTAAGPGIAGGK